MKFVEIESRARTLASALVGAALALWVASAPAAEAANPPAKPVAAAAEVADEPATLSILNREVVTLRAHVLGASPQMRVQRVVERLREMPSSAADAPLNIVAASLGDIKGVQFLLGDRLLLSLVEGDVDVESRENFDALVKQTQARLEGVRVAWNQSRDGPRLLEGALRTLVATLAFGALIWGTYRAGRKAVAWMESKRDVLAARFAHVDWREFLARLAVGTAVLVQWFVLLALGYLWIYFVLASFVVTSPLALQLVDWLLDKAVWLGDGALQSLPGMATVVIVLIVTRAAVDVLGFFFDSIQRGRVQLPLFHPETIPATRRIFTLLAWGLGIAIAYPYLPGSSSDAFKGVSVLLGVMVTLGSAGIVTQAMSGLVLIYSRALRKGDFVDVNGVQGVVSEVASLATKVVTVRNEEITIPNSVVVSTPIRNFSKLGGTQGTLLTTKVTIGYDAPWRQVHELLIGAAQKTAGVRAAPAPYVFQRALSDFYVEYELFASIDDPAQRIPILSELHASIQDTFNEFGVQIMSPHFFGQPEQAVVVPKDQWFAAPARPLGS
jgi:small-conductance mechanosensitive channel